MTSAILHNFQTNETRMKEFRYYFIRSSKSIREIQAAYKSSKAENSEKFYFGLFNNSLIIDSKYLKDFSTNKSVLFINLSRAASPQVLRLFLFMRDGTASFTNYKVPHHKTWTSNKTAPIQPSITSPVFLSGKTNLPAHSPTRT